MRLEKKLTLQELLKDLENLNNEISSKQNSKFGYINHPFWFGLPENIIKIMVVFQVLAMIGFLTAVISWIRYPPKQGIMYKNNLFYTLILFLLSASIWPIVTYYKIHWAAVLSIILTAVSSILLLAGTIEEAKEDIESFDYEKLS